MDKTIFIFGIVDILLALLIAYYQQKRGFHFFPTFFKALIGLVGLSAMLYKALYL